MHAGPADPQEWHPSPTLPAAHPAHLSLFQDLPRLAYFAPLPQLIVSHESLQKSVFLHGLLTLPSFHFLGFNSWLQLTSSGKPSLIAPFLSQIVHSPWALPNCWATVGSLQDRYPSLLAECVAGSSPREGEGTHHQLCPSCAVFTSFTQQPFQVEVITPM